MNCKYRYIECKHCKQTFPHPLPAPKIDLRKEMLETMKANNGKGMLHMMNTAINFIHEHPSVLTEKP